MAARYRSFFRPMGTALLFSHPLIVEGPISIGGSCASPSRTSCFSVGLSAAW
jgi:hypothetical protein